MDKTSYKTDEIINALESLEKTGKQPSEIIEEYIKDVETLVDRMKDLYEPIHLGLGIVVKVTIQAAIPTTGELVDVIRTQIGTNEFMKNVISLAKEKEDE